MRKTITTLMVLILLASISAAQVGKLDAEAAIKDAEDNIERMMAAGFTVRVIDSILTEAKEEYEAGFYGFTIQLCARINTTTNQAFKTYAELNDARTEIGKKSEKGLDVTDASDLLELAQLEFDKENYAEAKRLVTEALVATEVAELINTPTFGGYLKKYWFVLLLAIIVIVVAFVIGYPKLEESRLAGRMDNLRREEKLVEKLMEETDTRYYKQANIGKGEYTRMRDEHEKRLAKIRADIASATEKFRSKTVELTEEEKELKGKCDKCIYWEKTKDHQLGICTLDNVTTGFDSGCDRWKGLS